MLKILLIALMLSSAWAQTDTDPKAAALCLSFKLQDTQKYQDRKKEVDKKFPLLVKDAERFLKTITPAERSALEKEESREEQMAAIEERFKKVRKKYSRAKDKHTKASCPRGYDYFQYSSYARCERHWENGDRLSAIPKKSVRKSISIATPKEGELKMKHLHLSHTYIDAKGNIEEWNLRVAIGSKKSEEESIKMSLHALYGAPTLQEYVEKTIPPGCLEVLDAAAKNDSSRASGKDLPSKNGKAADKSSTGARED